MKPMLLSSSEVIPTGDEWIYETKYDGYRAILHWNEETPTIISRNNRDITSQFPELIDFCKSTYKTVQPFLPLTLDGEIVFLENNYRSNFSVVQTRGKMRTKQSIIQASQRFPCNFIVFDLIRIEGKEISSIPLTERKEKLQLLFNNAKLPKRVNYIDKGRIQLIGSFTQSEILLEKIKIHNGEGIIAKRNSSLWESGKRSKQWIKIKNWRIVSVIVTSFDLENDYFSGAIYIDNQLTDIVNFKHGLSEEQFQTLSTFFKTKGEKISNTTWTIPPSICVDIACIDFDGKKLREPRFHSFRFDLSPEEIHWRHFQRQVHPIPEHVQVTHPDKPVWPKIRLQKEDYLLYLEKCAPYLLPFLQNRLLTAIRYPHGVPGESFYQKNAPDYTPSFVERKQEDSINYILCNEIDTLMWLGNQLALEFHIPFQTVDTTCPTEIVFDLDPPSVDEFSLAIEAAIRMKTIFDQFQLQSFIKTSGGKGLQVYIPLPKNEFTYEETRIFTEFICKFLVEQEPHMFTLERMKKNRGKKLYLDYVQHWEGKTIIAPYSTRGNELGCVATPLYWDEVKEGLHPQQFTIPKVIERLSNLGNPFINFFDVGEKQNFRDVLTALKELTK